MERDIEIEVRDGKLYRAVQDFFSNDGDAHEFKYIVTKAIRDMDVAELGMSTKTLKAVKLDAKINTIGELEDLTDRQLICREGIGWARLTQLRGALSSISPKRIFGGQHAGA